ncbi:MAG: hypothetical protein JWQ87_2177 [Candidatus Sulfotelmatobacter sp.]|nr:hypothetical protein [Candidatus Sulfotelmatobacter sp.]
MIKKRIHSAVVISLAALLFMMVCITPTIASGASGLNWTQLSPASSPPARSYPSMAFDPISRQVVLFGGYNGSYLNDTWTFDGATWTQVKTSIAPPVRTNASMAFDRVTLKLVLFGGYNGHVDLGDTWLWDGAKSTWTQVIASKSPKAVTGPMLFTDPLNGRVDDFGGFDGNFYQLKTYQWTGTTWRELNPAGSAYARSIAVCATDAATKATVMFGGLADVNPNNTWTWNGTTWTQQNPSLQPSDRYGSPGVYDPRLKRVIVFGGGQGGGDINDTWAWNGSQWAQQFPSTSPPAREGYGMAFDGAIGHIVIFGGEAGSTIFGDTWELDPE